MFWVRFQMINYNYNGDLTISVALRKILSRRSEHFAHNIISGTTNLR